MMKSVQYKNRYYMMAWNLYLPEDFDENKKYPAIVIVHPGGWVKEQVSGLYAQRLSELWYIALAYDASHQWESGWEPRYLENPYERVNDVRVSVDYLCSLDYVDNDRIWCLGICAWWWYSVNATCSEHRIKAIATISWMDVWDAYRMSTPDVDAALKSAWEDRNRIYRWEEPHYINYIPNTKEEAEATWSVMIKEAYDYYRTPRAQHPNAKNILVEASVSYLLSFNAFEPIPYLLTQPILMIAWSEAETKGYSEKGIEMAKSEKELYLVEWATHVSLYDNKEHVDIAVNKLKEFYGKYL